MYGVPLNNESKIEEFYYSFLQILAGLTLLTRVLRPCWQFVLKVCTYITFHLGYGSLYFLTFGIDHSFFKTCEGGRNEYVVRLPEDLLAFYKMVSGRCLACPDVLNEREQWMFQVFACLKGPSCSQAVQTQPWPPAPLPLSCIFQSGKSIRVFS
jgi:hypothetical protein